MNDGLKSFVNNIGILCETWTLTYTSFVKQGMGATDAMTHTQAFMTSLIAASMQSNIGNTGGNVK